jgi:hypothetical protein
MSCQRHPSCRTCRRWLRCRSAQWGCQCHHRSSSHSSRWNPASVRKSQEDMNSCNCINANILASPHQHGDPRSLRTRTHKQATVSFAQRKVLWERARTWLPSASEPSEMMEPPKVIVASWVNWGWVKWTMSAN